MRKRDENSSWGQPARGYCTLVGSDILVFSTGTTGGGGGGVAGVVEEVEEDEEVEAEDEVKKEPTHSARLPLVSRTASVCWSQSNPSYNPNVINNR